MHKKILGVLVGEYKANKMETNDNKNKATLLHLSALSQYIFPFGNIIFPTILWSAFKEKSPYADSQGKQVLNFQLSLFIYSLILGMIAFPIIVIAVLKDHFFSFEYSWHDFAVSNLHHCQFSTSTLIAIIAVSLFVVLKIAEFFLIIYAAVKTSNGEDFKYPLCFHFIK